MKKISPSELKKKLEVILPGSKSYTHRMLIASALSDGVCEITAPLQSEDTLLTMEALRAMGANIERYEDRMIVHGNGGKLSPVSDEPIYLANSGTSMRLLTGVFALSEKEVVLTGNERMQERPIHPLLESLNILGIDARSLNETGCPPVSISGGLKEGGKTTLDCSISSQYLSGLLLAAPVTRKGLDITLVNNLVSKPYIDMTMDIMGLFGIEVINEDYKRFIVKGNQTYKSSNYMVEPDCSNASYFFGSAAVKRSEIKVKGVSFSSSQGDIQFVRLLQEMGCFVREDKDGIYLKGAPLKGIDADMKNMPDVAPTLAVVASFAEGETRIFNVAHLREKECDRIGCVVKELLKLGIDARETEDGMIIKGGRHKYASISTYNDHRMAMCFSIAGIASDEGVIIEDETCVKKSFPNFWEVFEGIFE